MKTNLYRDIPEVFDPEYHKQVQAQPLTDNTQAVTGKDAVGRKI